MRARTMVALALAALLLPASTSAATSFGVVDDQPEYAPDGGAAFYSQLNDVGLSVTRVSVVWHPELPTAITEVDALAQTLPLALAHNIRIIFSVIAPRARSLTTPAAQQSYAAFLQQIARAFPQVKDFIVANEPNQPRFWQPQFSSKGVGVSGAAYEALLAQSYDALKAVDPTIHVIGSLSPRGNDMPHAKDNVSTSPVRFIHDVGVAYRASHRTKPLMDLFGFHIYPRTNTDSPAKGYHWPNAGAPNLDRIKQAVWDAFNGTAQPTFAEGPAALSSPAPGAPAPLKFVLAEVGWQVAPLPGLAQDYTGQENVPTISETTQARYYGDLIREFECDPSVSTVLFFLLKDEADLKAWQSGLIRVDGSPRPAYGAVKAALAATGGSCLGKAVLWRHTATVVGARVAWRLDPRRTDAPAVRISAAEQVTYTAGVFRVDGLAARGRAQSRSVISRELDSATAQSRVVSASGSVRAYRHPWVSLARGGVLTPGVYVCAVRLSAAMNPARTTLVISAPFRVAA